MIKKYLFINTEETYYKYDHKAKDIINEAYK